MIGRPFSTVSEPTFPSVSPMAMRLLAGVAARGVAMTTGTEFAEPEYDLYLDYRSAVIFCG